LFAKDETKFQTVFFRRKKEMKYAIQKHTLLLFSLVVQCCQKKYFYELILQCSNSIVLCQFYKSKLLVKSVTFDYLVSLRA